MKQKPIAVDYDSLSSTSGRVFPVKGSGPMAFNSPFFFCWHSLLYNCKIEKKKKRGKKVWLNEKYDSNLIH